MCDRSVDHKLVEAGYTQCAKAYEIAVDVTKFTWTAFYTRSAAVLGGAGYVLVNKPQYGWAGGLLLLASAATTAIITRNQMERNQAVIQKAIAAGAFLERENPDLGCRFRLDAFGDHNLHSKSLESLWKGPDDLHNLHIHQLALTPKFRSYCYIHA
ncbi:MAG: hypothetical protein JNG88_10770, partial [Phycisphaerales bacterium]|nr:hypothetical protein [Phycisphaerales bacterium]